MSSSEKMSMDSGHMDNHQAEQQIPIDGLKQVIEMLRIADPAFRESLLKRLAQRDRQLAQTLRESLTQL